MATIFSWSTKAGAVYRLQCHAVAVRTAVCRRHREPHAPGAEPGRSAAGRRAGAQSAEECEVGDTAGLKIRDPGTRATEAVSDNERARKLSGPTSHSSSPESPCPRVAGAYQAANAQLRIHSTEKRWVIQPEISTPDSQHDCHLVPGLVYFAAVNALDGEHVEDHLAPIHRRSLWPGIPRMAILPP